MINILEFSINFSLIFIWYFLWILRHLTKTSWRRNIMFLYLLTLPWSEQPMIFIASLCDSPVFQRKIISFWWSFKEEILSVNMRVHVCVCVRLGHLLQYSGHFALNVSLPIKEKCNFPPKNKRRPIIVSDSHPLLPTTFLRLWFFLIFFSLLVNMHVCECVCILQWLSLLSIIFAFYEKKLCSVFLLFNDS